MKPLLAICAVIGLVSPVMAEPAAAPPCFQIIPPTASMPPFQPIKLNVCTGESWLLVRMPLEKGYFTYRWQALSHAEQEPMLHDANPFAVPGIAPVH